ncbi:RNA polymerase sigma factor [Danxiaibacter flavus]|uniref:RNA polymerase sigma factor n=1 Tax=Danxiaibacter flavus TaxID=3049108 RepID=A0ABV3ZHF2_9BACT|nr:RNA polymerase sigma factor [Chitinophagaceae bacterium DXS]
MQETELIKECLKGNRSAQHLLYSRYSPAMLGICYRYTKNIADAEDILQEAFIKVFTKLHQYRNDGELGGWIRRIMINTSISYLNKHNRYKRELQIEDIPMHPVSDETPEIHVDTKQLVELVRELPVIYQTVFNLVAIEGYNHIEVAKLLNSKENTIRSQYSRARSLLIDALKKIADQSEKKNYAGRI